MQTMIDAFWVKHAQLQQAVSTGDELLIDYLDRELDPLLRAIVDREARSMSEARLQFGLILDLLQQDADDRSAVLRYCATLRGLARRYMIEDPLACGGRSDRKQLMSTRRRAPSMDDGLLNEAILNALPDRVTVITPDYRYLYANKLHSRRMEHTPMGLVGRHVAEFVGMHRFESRVRPYLDRCFGGEDVDYTFAKQVEERTVVVRCRMTPCRAANGRILGAIVILQEMPDRRRAIAA